MGLARFIKCDDFFLPFQTNSEFGFKHEINFSTTHFFLQYYLQCVVTPVNIVLHLSSNIESWTESWTVTNSVRRWENITHAHNNY